MVENYRKIITEKIKEIQKEVDTRRTKNSFVNYMQFFFIVMFLAGFLTISLSQHYNEILVFIIGGLGAIVGLAGFLLSLYYESRIDFKAWDKALWIAANWLTTDIKVDRMIFRYHHSHLDDDIDRALGILHKLDITIEKEK